MAFQDLREFLDLLDKRGQLRRITVPVTRDLEITEIADRVVKGPAAGNVALLCERVDGFSMPLLINAFGTEERMAWALGVERLDELGEKVRQLLDLRMPGSLLEKLRKGLELLEVARTGPKVVKTGPCQEAVETAAPSLADLPALRCWPKDAGYYITFPLVISRDPVTGLRNVGTYRLQVYDERTLGMHWQTHKGGAEHEREARRVGRERIPVAIALGADPATMYTGTAPLPPGLDELMLAGWIRGKGVELVRCRTIDLEVPAHAEIVLEGFVDPAESRTEGPFGDHTGYYSLAGPYPVFHLTAVTRRRYPIYPTIIVGRPPMEDYWLGKATERLFLPIIRMMLPEIVDMNMPAEGVFHNLVIVSVKKRYPGQARKVMYGLWGLGLLMLAKNVVVVDEWVDVHDVSEVAWRVSNNIDPARDLVVVEGPTDDLDHAALRHRYGGKLGIDATEKRPPLDRVEQPWPEEIRMTEEVRQRVSQRWREYGLG
ncbi:MAG: menaquinone biosynthesis decarboxylase [Candidatus Rokuibacteriota bacterium]